MKVLFNGGVIAESDKTIKLEGNHYFPADSIKKQFFKKSESHSDCPWKGVASYYHLEVKGERSSNAAWYYPHPNEAAGEIKDMVAFYENNVEIVK